MIKILAIDDINDNLISLRAILKDLFADAVVLTAQSGRKGIDLAIAEHPDVILLDIVMPGMDGFEVCQQLKKNEQISDIPVVFLTALKGDKENRIKALEIGADGFLSKPIDETELTAQIRAMVKIKRANEANHAEKVKLEKLVAERTSALEKELEERKLAEEAIKKTENHYKALIEKAYDGVVLINGEGQFSYISPSAKMMFGFPLDFPFKFSPDELTHPDDLPALLEELNKLLADPDYIPTLQYRFAARDGSWKWIESTFRNLLSNSDINAIVINFRDINERKIADELLKRSEFFFKETQSAAFIGSYQFDLSADFWSSSEILEQIFGINSNYDRSLEGWLDLIHPDDREMMDEYFSKDVVEKKLSFRKEYRIIRKSNGETRWVLGLGKLNYDELGNVKSMIGTIQDITWRKQQEEILQETNELNRSLLQTIPFGMEIVDLEGNILFMNESLKRMVGQDITGKKCWQLNRDDRKQCLDCPLMTGFEIGITKFYESTGVLGGKTFLISHTGMVFKGKKAMLEIFQDVTEKKVVEQKVKLLAHSLESINECVSVTDNEDIIIYINKSFEHTYGYTAKELIGQHTSLLRPPDIALAHIRDILPITIEGGWRGEIINRKKDGTFFPISLSTSVIRDEENNPVALIGVATDITEARKSRDELIEAKDKAEESNRLKSAFLNNMSHEIRTPMNHIMGFSSLMAEAESKEKDEFAAIILNSSNQLLSLIENVILLSRLQSERTEINNQPCGMNDLFTHLGELFQPECKPKNISLHINISPKFRNLTILCDAEKIRHIMINLLSNAVKYTQQGTIEIGFDVVEKIHVEKIHEFSLPQQQIQFYVKDTGLGIPLHEQPKIFDSFYRTEQAMSNAIGGTGLGLSIVRELVKSLNGHISIDSAPGEGSTFSFTIPLTTTGSIMELQRSIITPRHKLKEMVLLIADDEQINFLYLEIMLKNLVKRIDYAFNGLQAIEMVDKQHYDMVFMDLKMPEMNGYEATKIIKQHHPEMTIIAQTAYASPEDKEKALQAGCDDFIAKPIKKSLLLETLHKFS